MKKKIECLIMDWAGTAVDYGCFAPVAAFMESFKQIGAPVTASETRAHMGLTKIEEIRALFAIDRVSAAFAARHGRPYTEEDIADCYQRFQTVLFASLTAYSKPIPGVVETISSLRNEGIKVGSTTGYTAKMMDTVIPAAEQWGYHVDYCATSDDLPGGRPKPYMIYQNLCRLDVADRRSVVKLGDTVADIREGVNAGVWSVGVIMGSNEMGLTEAETSALSDDERRARIEEVRNRMYAAGADYVIERIEDLPTLISCIEARMNNF